MSSADDLAAADVALRQGQASEAQGSTVALVEAVRCYETAIARLEPFTAAGDDVLRHRLGVAWMNRGNALRKQSTPDTIDEAVRSYDQTIALVGALPIEANLVYRNCLGAAWVNRGSALLQRKDDASLAEAIRSHEESIALLRTLPLDRVPDYRINLAGTLVNLANAFLFRETPENIARARTAAAEALALVADRADHDIEFARLELKARRAVCVALGHQLFARRAEKEVVAALVAETSDVVDAGIALARRWEMRGAAQLRPLTERLFHFGAQLYQRHQPQFLAEFILESLDPAAAPPGWTHDPALLEIAAKAVTQARDHLGLEPILNIDPATLAKLRETSRSLEEVAAHLAAWRTGQPTPTSS